MNQYKLDLLNPGAPVQAIAEEVTQVTTLDIRNLDWESKEISGDLTLAVTPPRTAAELDKVQENGSIDERGVFIALHKATILLEVPEGAEWTLRRDAAQTVTWYVSTTAVPILPLKKQALYSPLFGGDAAGSKNAATSSLMQAMGFKGDSVRGVANMVQQLGSDGVDITRLLVRAASLLLGIRLRTGGGGLSMDVPVVEPPQVTHLIDGASAVTFWQRAVAGCAAFLVHPDRAIIDTYVLTTVMRLMLSRRVDWPVGAGFVTDQFWPELSRKKNQPSYMGMLDAPPLDWGAVSANDVFTAVEILLADLALPRETFTKHLEYVLTMSYHVRHEGLLGLTAGMSLGLPISRLAGLAITPVLDKPPGEGLLSTEARVGDLKPLLMNCCRKADVLRRGWHGVRAVLSDIPSHFDVEARRVFLDGIVSGGPMQAYWGLMQQVVNEMGHAGDIGEWVRAAVCTGKKILTTGAYVGIPRNTRKVPTLHILGVGMHFPPLPEVNAWTSDERWAGVAALAAGLGIPGNPERLVRQQVWKSTLVNMPVASTFPRNVWGAIVPATGGCSMTYSACISDPIVRTVLGAGMKLRSPDTVWMISDKSRGLAHPLAAFGPGPPQTWASVALAGAAAAKEDAAAAAGEVAAAGAAAIPTTPNPLPFLGGGAQPPAAAVPPASGVDDDSDYLLVAGGSQFEKLPGAPAADAAKHPATMGLGVDKANVPLDAVKEVSLPILADAGEEDRFKLRLEADADAAARDDLDEHFMEAPQEDERAIEVVDGDLVLVDRGDRGVTAAMGQGTAAAAAARGIAQQINSCSPAMADAFVARLGAKMAFPAAACYYCTSNATPAAQEMAITVAELQLATTRSLKAAAKVAARSVMHAYPKNPTEWSDLEVKEARQVIAASESCYRQKEVDDGITDCLLKKSESADVENVLDAVVGRGAWEFFAAQGSFMVTSTSAVFGKLSEPVPPPWVQPEKVVRVDMGHGVVVTNAMDPRERMVVATRSGKFGVETILSNFQMPKVPTTLTGDSVSVVNVMGTSYEGGYVSHLARAGGGQQVLISTKKSAVVGRLVSAALGLGVGMTIAVTGGLDIDSIVTRQADKTKTQAAQAASKKSKAEKKEGMPPGGTAKASDLPPSPADRGGENEAAFDAVLDDADEKLTGWGLDGQFDQRRAFSLALFLMRLAGTAPSRKQYVRAVDIGMGLLTGLDAQLVCNPGCNQQIEAMIAAGKTTAHLDSPQLSPVIAVAAAHGKEDPDGLTGGLRRVVGKELGVWRASVMAEYRLQPMVQIANTLRTYLDDEESAVSMACRLVGATGVETPLEVVRRAISVGCRGCSDNMCWCGEAVPDVDVDKSRTTGGDTVVVGRTRCRWRLQSSHPWMMRWLITKGGRLPTDPWLILAMFPGVVSVEQLRSVVVDMDLTPNNWDDYESPRENKRLGGMPIDCTLKMARHATEACHAEKWLYECNAPPQAKCGHLLWVSGLTESVRLVLENNGMHKLPLAAWRVWNKEVGPIIRRAGMVGHLKGEYYLEMRKVTSVCVREALRADYEGERLARTCRPVVKSSPAVDYRSRFEVHLRTISEHAVGRVLRRGDSRTLGDEWASRAVSAPSGSSSGSQYLKELGRGSDDAAPSDRPNKKAVLSALPSSWLAQFGDLTRVALARASTKPEPGDKARLLLASGDGSTFIGTHGLRGMEGSGNHGGMAASQRPEIVGEWLHQCDATRGATQTSADLDNYNGQHELWELQRMWRSRAEQYRAVGGQIASDRAASCDWIADSMRLSVVLAEGQLYRVYLGLYSGHRGTTWDNTNKHEIDRLVALDNLSAIGLRVEHFGATESGDDEWLKTTTWAEAVYYLQMCKFMGLRMNAKKQLVGLEHGEYLQRCVAGDAVPKQPLASVLATLVTGNWYRPSGTWLDAAMSSCCSNWLEASARGLRRTVAARMCGMLLDQLLVDRKPGERYVPLDWRRYVRSTAPGQQLFMGCIGYGEEVAPDFVVRQRMKPNWKSHGVSSYLDTPEARWILRSLDKDWLRDQFRESIAIDTHGSCEMNTERDRVGRLIASRWPKGCNFTEVPLSLPELAPGPGLAKTTEAWAAAHAQGRAITEEDNLAAMGLGRREAQLMGGYEGLLRTAPPEKLARVRPLRAPPDMLDRVAADINVIAGLGVHAADQPDFCLRLPGREERTVVVVAAAHGCGLSRLARRFQQKQVARYDRVAAAWVGKDAYHRPTGSSSHDDLVFSGVAEVVAMKLASGCRPQLKVMLTHEHPNLIVDALRRQGISARWILYSPDDAERARRLSTRHVVSSIHNYMINVRAALMRERAPAVEYVMEEEIVQAMACMAC